MPVKKTMKIKKNKNYARQITFQTKIVGLSKLVSWIVFY